MASRSIATAVVAAGRAATHSAPTSGALRARGSGARSTAWPTFASSFHSASHRDGQRQRNGPHASVAVGGAAVLSLAALAALLAYDSDRRTVHLEAAAPGARAGIVPADELAKRKDPATGTELPTTLRPLSAVGGSGEALALLGLGVRTVSFLKVRVYVAGVYVDERLARSVALRDPSSSSSPSPSPSPSEECGERTPEATVRALLDAGVPLVVRIVPVRSTDFNHLRDGFTRSVQARLKAARKAQTLSPQADEEVSASLQALKGLFPPASLPKGSALDLVVHPVRASAGSGGKARAALTLEEGGKVLGTLEPPGEGSEAAKGGWSVAKELVLAYVADKNEISTPVKLSVAEGLKERFK